MAKATRKRDGERPVLAVRRIHLVHSVPAGRRRLSTYVTHVVTHPLNLLSMTAAVLLALLSWNAFVLVVAAVLEIALLMLLPWHGGFRRQRKRRDYLQAQSEHHELHDSAAFQWHHKRWQGSLRSSAGRTGWSVVRHHRHQ